MLRNESKMFGLQYTKLCRNNRIEQLCLVNEKFVYHKRCKFSHKKVNFSLHITYNSLTLLARFPDNPWRIRVASGFEFSVCLFVCL